MLRYTLILGYVFVLLCASDASAASLDHYRSARLSTPTSTTTDSSLQEVLDDLVVSGPPIDANAPSGVELFNPSFSAMTLQLAFSFGEPGQRVTLGIYDADDPSNRLSLLRRPLSTGSAITVTFLANGDVSINGKRPKSLSGFDGAFGFYVKTWTDPKQPVILYTEADLNAGGTRAKVFQGNNETQLELPGLRPGLFLDSQFLIAWETGLGAKNDGDFNDLIVSASAITPAVPEPGAAALVGLALLGAFARMRRARPN